MRVLFACLVALALLASTHAEGAPGFDDLAARSDLAIFGQVLQVGELGGAPAVTIAIDRQLRGVEAAGALTFTGDVSGWRVGERSCFFLRRRDAPAGAPRFVSMASRAISLAASVDLVSSEPIRSASLRKAAAAEPEGGVSIPGVAAGLVTALGIFALARRRR